MAATMNYHRTAPLCKTQFHESAATSKPKTEHRTPSWYSPETGIYRSNYRSIPFPEDPFLDVVSFIFSHKHNGVSALIDSSSGSSIPYNDLHSLVKSMATGLKRLGVKQGDVVLLLLPNSIYFPIVFLGILYLGAVVTAMNPLSRPVEIKKRLEECNPCLAFTMKSVRSSNLGVPAIAVPEDANLDLMRSGYSEFRELISSSSSDYVSKGRIKQEDTAVILYSSGTTGRSKGVVITHRNLIASVELFVRFEASTYEYSSSSNVYLAIVPMFHIYGLSLYALGLLSLGSTIVVMGKFDLGEVLKVIDIYGVTHFPLVPPILAALAKRSKGVCGNSLKSLKQVSCGAAPISKKVIDDFVQNFPSVDFIQGYGLTESTAVGTRGFNTGTFRKYTSVGLLAPNMEAKLVDISCGSFLPPGKQGELWLRGPGIMKGYWNNAEATRMTIEKDGWLHTGDIAYFDQDGYLYIIDRIKDIIKFKGFQIAPADLEAVLICHPDIVDVAVTASHDEECGEIPVAFVVRKHGSMLTQEDVTNYMAGQVAPYKKVRKVVFAASLPRSAAGKILRRELRQVLQSKL